jgi:hypothetical protein
MTLELKLSEAEATWLRGVLGRIAGRYDDPHALPLQRRVDALLQERDAPAAPEASA